MGKIIKAEKRGGGVGIESKVSEEYTPLYGPDDDLRSSLVIRLTLAINKNIIYIITTYRIFWILKNHGNFSFLDKP